MSNWSVEWLRAMLGAFFVLAALGGARADEKSAGDTDPTVRLAFVGDIMLDTLPGERIARGDDPFEPFAAVLGGADIAVGNLECVIATTGEAEDKPYTFRAHPRCVHVLARHFQALSMANNHSGDFGKGAFAEQLDLLKEGKLPGFGGGHNLKEAHRPLVLERNGLRIALLGYNEFPPRRFEAGDDTPGLAWSNDEQVVADIKAARDEFKADLVIPFMHWGIEGEPEPSDRQKQLARTMIDAGADLVVGGHPHVTEGAEYYRGHLIVYSLGNFVFDEFDTEVTLTGWVLRLTVNKQGLVEWDTVVAKIDGQGIPHPDRQAKSPCGNSRSEKIESAAAKLGG